MYTLNALLMPLDRANKRKPIKDASAGEKCHETLRMYANALPTVLRSRRGRRRRRRLARPPFDDDGEIECFPRAGPFSMFIAFIQFSVCPIFEAARVTHARVALLHFYVARCARLAAPC